MTNKYFRLLVLTFALASGLARAEDRIGHFDAIEYQNSGNKVTLKAPSGLTSWNMTLPTTAGSSGQFLATNGSGVLSWLAPSSISGQINVSSGGGTPASATNAISSVDVAASATITNDDTIGLNTSMILGLGADSTSTAGTFGSGYVALGLPMVLQMHDGATADLVGAAAFALALDASNDGGTIDKLYLGKFMAVPEGGTQTINNLYGLWIKFPFGDPATDSWGLYAEDGAHNWMKNSLKIGGDSGSTDRVSDNSLAIETDPSFSGSMLHDLVDSSLNISVDLDNRFLQNSDGVEVVDFQNGVLNDTNNLPSIDIFNRQLKDEAGNLLGSWTSGGLMVNKAINATTTATDAATVAGVFSATANVTVDGDITTVGINSSAAGVIATGATNDKAIVAGIYTATRGDHTDDGTAHEVDGSQVLIFHQGGAASVTDKGIGYGLTQFLFGGNVTDLYDFKAEVVPAGATVTNHYGLALGSAGATNEWGVYAAGATQNWFAGAIKIGGSSGSTDKVSAAGIALETTGGFHVKTNGVVHFANMDTTARDALTGLEAGDQIFNTTTRALEYWDGTDWN